MRLVWYTLGLSIVVISVVVLGHSLRSEDHPSVLRGSFSNRPVPAEQGSIKREREVIEVQSTERELLRAQVSGRFGHDRDQFAAADQMLSAMLAIFESNHPPQEVLTKISRAVACRVITFDAVEGRDVGLWIESLVVNSPSRSEAYMKWNADWNGSLMNLPELKREIVCDS